MVVVWFIKLLTVLIRNIFLLLFRMLLRYKFGDVWFGLRISIGYLNVWIFDPVQSLITTRSIGEYF